MKVEINGNEIKCRVSQVGDEPGYGDYDVVLKLAPRIGQPHRAWMEIEDGHCSPTWEEMEKLAELILNFTARHKNSG